jgi:hypothetical protein
MADIFSQKTQRPLGIGSCSTVTFGRTLAQQANHIPAAHQPRRNGTAQNTHQQCKWGYICFHRILAVLRGFFWVVLSGAFDHSDA